MKKSLLFFVKCLAIILIYVAFSNIVGALTFSLFGIDFSNRDMPDTNRVLTGSFTVAILQSLIFILLALRSRLTGVKLGIFISLVSFSINELLNFIEGLVFLQNIYPVNAQLVGFLNGIILSGAMGFGIALLFGKKKSELAKEEVPVFAWSKKLIAPWIGWIFIWFVIYIVAGMLIPMNTLGVFEYYFGENGAMDASLVPIGYILQIPRASIWILIAIALFKYTEGTALEKALITGLTFGSIMCSSLLIPNFIMPDIVRLSHLPEIMFANLLWGFIISMKVGKRFISR